MRFLKLTAGLAVVAAAMAAAQSAFAEGLGEAVPWQMGLQDAATPLMDTLRSFHNLLLVIITVVALSFLASWSW